MTDDQDAQDRQHYTCRMQGTCARAVEFSLDADDNVHDVAFMGGCNGNLKGISSLIEGMSADAVIDRVAGTTCGGKPTSCPDQLARALKSTLATRRA